MLVGLKNLILKLDTDRELRNPHADALSRVPLV